MYKPGRKPGTIRFSIAPGGGVHRVDVAGEFSGWKLQSMRRHRDGHYEATVAGCSGATCQYKFLVDGRWITDPDNKSLTANSFGTLNSVANLTAGHA